MTMTTIIAIVLAIVFIAFCLLCIVALSAHQKETKEFQKKIQSIEQDLGDMNGLILEKLNQHEELLEKQTTIMKIHSQAEPVRQGVAYEKAASQTIPQERFKQGTSQEQHIEAEPREMIRDDDWGIKLDDLLNDIEDVGDFVDVGTFEDVIPQELATDPAVNPGNGSVASADTDFLFSDQPQRMTGDEENIDMLSDILGIENTLNDFDDFTRRTLHGEQLFENFVPESEPIYTSEPDPVYEPESEPVYVPEMEPGIVDQPSPVQDVDYAVGRSGKKYTSSELEKLIRE